MNRLVRAIAAMAAVGFIGACTAHGPGELVTADPGEMATSTDADENVWPSDEEMPDAGTAVADASVDAAYSGAGELTMGSSAGDWSGYTAELRFEAPKIEAFTEPATALGTTTVTVRLAEDAYLWLTNTTPQRDWLLSSDDAGFALQAYYTRDSGVCELGDNAYLYWLDGDGPVNGCTRMLTGWNTWSTDYTPTVVNDPLTALPTGVEVQLGGGHPRDGWSEDVPDAEAERVADAFAHPDSIVLSYGSVWSGAGGALTYCVAIRDYAVLVMEPPISAKACSGS